MKVLRMSPELRQDLYSFNAYTDEDIIEKLEALVGEPVELRLYSPWGEAPSLFSGEQEIDFHVDVVTGKFTIKGIKQCQ